MPFRSTLDFLLYDWLKAEELTGSDKVILPQATHDANRAYAASGMLSAAQDYEEGGMQLPYTIEAAANGFFGLASVSMGSSRLTEGNANLLLVHGTEAQKTVFARNEFAGRFSGTMCLADRINGTIAAAFKRPALDEYSRLLGDALQQVQAATAAAWATRDPGAVLANAVPYMQAFGHMVLAWIWLDVALAVPEDTQRDPSHVGRMSAVRYFYRYELPKIGAWLAVVSSCDPTCADMPEEAF